MGTDLGSSTDRMHICKGIYLSWLWHSYVFDESLFAGYELVLCEF
jgi:hypothetical protein